MAFGSRDDERLRNRDGRQSERVRLVGRSLRARVREQLEIDAGFIEDAAYTRHRL